MVLTRHRLPARHEFPGAFPLDVGPQDQLLAPWRCRWVAGHDCPHLYVFHHSRQVAHSAFLGNGGCPHLRHLRIRLTILFPCRRSAHGLRAPWTTAVGVVLVVIATGMAAVGMRSVQAALASLTPRFHGFSLDEAARHLPVVDGPLSGMSAMGRFGGLVLIAAIRTRVDIALHPSPTSRAPFHFSPLGMAVVIPAPRAYG